MCVLLRLALHDWPEATQCGAFRLRLRPTQNSSSKRSPGFQWPAGNVFTLKTSSNSRGLYAVKENDWSILGQTTKIRNDFVLEVLLYIIRGSRYLDPTYCILYASYHTIMSWKTKITKMWMTSLRISCRRFYVESFPGQTALFGPLPG